MSWTPCGNTVQMKANMFCYSVSRIEKKATLRLRTETWEVLKWIVGRSI